MKARIIFLEILLALVIVGGFKLADSPQLSPAMAASSLPVKGSPIIGCSPDWNNLDADSLADAIMPLPGWGNYSWDIGTASDSARFYFNQGINMYYAFHIIESMASFKKAAQFDELNPMIYWAQALAYGPNINDIAYAATADALAAAEKASQLSTSASARDRALVAAMHVRYSPDSSISRTTLDQLYATEMKKLVTQFPTDADVLALYADALMLQHPWDYWQHNGQAQPWTPGIVSTLEKALKVQPQHPGANHYYIHAVEASRTPGRAMASADRLGKMMPQVSHMVHMPSHIYIRTGNYEKGVKVNELSISGFKTYQQLYPGVNNNSFLYLVHNLHMKTACAMMRPNYAASIQAAMDCRASLDTSFLSLPLPLGNMAQYIYMIPEMVYVRYGKWNEISEVPPVHENYVFASFLSRWSKAMALVHMGQSGKAKVMLDQLRQNLENPSLAVANKPFNKAIDQARVAVKILEGTISEKENHLIKAIAYYKEAVMLEDELIYTEPRDWLIPSRHYYANALLKSGQPALAEKVLKEDLAINPANFYALKGLELVAVKNKNIGQQAHWKKQLRQVYNKSDLLYPSVVY